MISALSASLIIEGTLALLLLATLFFCVRLEFRLRQLRKDKETLSGTVRALNAAIATARESLAGLRAAAREADENLGRNVSNARALADELSLLASAGERIATRIENARKAQAHSRPGEAALFGEALRGLR